MKKVILLFTTALLVSACEVERHMSIDMLDNESRLVVYCMPSAERDTTIIQVSHSLPINGNHGAYSDAFVPIENCDISYRVNGEARTVVALPMDESTPTVPPGSYYVVGQHAPGDRIDLTVSHEGFPPTSATTVVPAPVSIGPLSMRSVSRLSEYDSRENYYQLMADIEGQPNEYYAVQVEQLVTRHYYWADTLRCDSSHASIPITTLDEPLLNPLTDADEEFEYDNSFIGNLYIFAGSSLPDGRPYTLHLDVSHYGHSGTLRLVFYRLTPEYYRFVKSVNDANNNGMAEYGLSTITPTFSNVNGGLGFVGAYAAVVTDWLDVDPDSYPIYY